MKSFNKQEFSLPIQLDREIKSFARSAMVMWFRITPVLFVLNPVIIKKYRQLGTVAKKERVFQMMIGSKVMDSSFGGFPKEDVSKMHRNVAREKRRSNYFKSLMSFSPKNVEDDKYYEFQEIMPIIFEETFERISTQNGKKTGCEMEEDDSLDTLKKIIGGTEDLNSLKIVILCHGFQGSHSDMIKIKHYFKINDPESHYICSKANQSNTTGDISEMGLKLSQEVDSLLIQSFANETIKSISFVGHSLGNTS